MAEKPTVLIVDDAIFMRSMLKDIIETAGFEVIGEAGDGFEAVDLYDKLNPNIVTLDITMPKCDGIECLKKLKEVDPDCYVIMISALSQKDKVLESVKLGAKDFIVKPFTEENVVSTIQIYNKK
jgi:two-component system chemotaxis response regulator CheY